MASTDIYGRKMAAIKHPITADRCEISWNKQPAFAIQFNLSYQQSVNRRRTIGNGASIIYPTQPIGQISMARLLFDGNTDGFFSQPGWKACATKAEDTITVTLAGGCGEGGEEFEGYSLTASGLIVTAFQLSLEAEGLTVVDNVSIEFLQLTAN